MSSSVKLFKNQSYHELKQQCGRHKQLFEDPEFPAVDGSLFYSKSPPSRVEWKRPRELCEDPRLIVDGISSHDLHQGKLGNCWFVAACSCLAIKEKLWQKVIVNWKNQEWDRKNPKKYMGIFRFHFWCLGKWTEVVIDDRLPTVEGELIYCHSNVKNEFWSALLEKAYAKLAGSYEALDGGNTADAVVDFTGAVAEHLDLSQGKYRQDLIEQTKLFEDILKAYNRGGLISCSILPSSSADLEAVTELGLVKGHAYSVTAVRKVRLGRRSFCPSKVEKLFMIRMRNPWGKREWRGAWSDGSEEWKKVSQSERQSMGLTVADDGEFWMTFEDWCKNFTKVDIGRIINTSYFSIHKTWEKKLMRGAWSRNSDPLLDRSGGCFNNKVTFLQNPQYVFDIKKAEDTALISLQQKDQRVHRKEGKGDNFIIGFEIFKVELNREHRIHKLQPQEKVATSAYINVRTVFLKKVLKQGRYVIVPTTFQPGIVSEFILRLFTDVPSELRELALDKPEATCWSRLWGYPKRVTQVLVHKVEGLQQGDMNPFLIIKCERQKVRSPVQRKTSTAVFDLQAIFFRKNINQPLVIQVWNSKVVVDQFLGQVLLAASPSDPRELQRLQLRDKEGRGGGEMAGHISVKVISSDNLAEL
ncbi:calpain-6 isoform X2 [Rhinatrema bivittatum]|nr:calpain-6 isoform X2 [Rhinatrema bivittatum]XP_029463492.1 calpain-6 isoform X2 [Rhinatrema bivittatum]XP_029463493.1 calpain-6 isoform X2 [Rhinatrema bivittatum]XP_029463494.1 calpain-6 isoform X2 [Rhinatrema bivittatum]XP_029463495.1 calpain-6 isoform X2 [Rhinatrema bivittatum]